MVEPTLFIDEMITKPKPSFSLRETITSYVVAHLVLARTAGPKVLTGLALAHGYDTAFSWTAGILGFGAVVAFSLFRFGPLYGKGAPGSAGDGVREAATEAGPAIPA